MNIRKAIIDDLSRVAEIYVFNNRINFFPIFKDEVFSFGELQVVPLIDNYFKREDIIENICPLWFRRWDAWKTAWIYKAHRNSTYSNDILL